MTSICYIQRNWHGGPLHDGRPNAIPLCMRVRTGRLESSGSGQPLHVQPIKVPNDQHLLGASEDVTNHIRVSAIAGVTTLTEPSRLISSWWIAFGLFLCLSSMPLSLYLDTRPTTVSPWTIVYHEVGLPAQQIQPQFIHYLLIAPGLN